MSYPRRQQDKPLYSPQYPPYQVDFTAVRTGQHVSATKRNVRWRLGFSNPKALREGLTGPECRGEEHEVILKWSVTSGKRIVMVDGKEIHYSCAGMGGTFEYSWTMRGNHILKIIAHSTPSIMPGPNWRQFDLLLDGRSYFDFPKIYELGLTPEGGECDYSSAMVANERPTRIYKSYSLPDEHSQDYRRNDNYRESNYGRDHYREDNYRREYDRVDYRTDQNRRDYGRVDNYGADQNRRDYNREDNHMADYHRRDHLRASESPGTVLQAESSTRRSYESHYSVPSSNYRADQNRRDYNKEDNHMADYHRRDHLRASESPGTVSQAESSTRRSYESQHSMPSSRGEKPAFNPTKAPTMNDILSEPMRAPSIIDKNYSHRGY